MSPPRDEVLSAFHEQMHQTLAARRRTARALLRLVLRSEGYVPVLEHVERYVGPELVALHARDGHEIPPHGPAIARALAELVDETLEILDPRDVADLLTEQLTREENRCR